MDYIKDDEVKRLILEAARKVFQKWGINKTTMEDIAKEAGKGKSTLYYYFKSKEEIFDSLAQDEFYKILNSTKKSIEGISSAKEKIKNYVIITLTSMKQRIILYKVVTEEIKKNKALIDKLKTQMIQAEEEFITQILEEGRKNHEFSFIDQKEMQIAAKVIVGMVNAIELYLFIDNDDIELIDMAAKLISNGV